MRGNRTGSEIDGGAETKGGGRAGYVWRRFRKNRLAMVGLAIIVLLIGVAIFADLIANYHDKVIKINIGIRHQAPSLAHFFGTDEFGRDIFARVVHGTRISLFVGLISVGIALFFGGGLGAVAGYYGGKIDTVIMRLLDVLLAIPVILLAITIIASLGVSIINLMIAVGVANIPGFARVVRGAVLGVKGNEFIEAAKAIGSPNYKIILAHVLPNCFAPIMVYATLKVATAIMATAGLSFIGLGVKPPTPEWGSMLSAGRGFIRDHVHEVFFPGLAIMMSVLSLNMIGDGLRDALDPRLK
ncbi:MAG TPA: ABC transporter permease [Rectinemataceae bacterium]|nr:ABC transporter permease [Rectinemataceae bacterium]